MYCSKCGKQIQDSSSFCAHCGHPLGTVPSSSEPRHEFCEISWICKKKGLLADTLQFWAKATGPNGGYSAGESTAFRGASKVGPAPFSKADVEALETFLEELARAGWERMGTSGRAWYSHHLQRLVK